VTVAGTIRKDTLRGTLGPGGLTLQIHTGDRSIGSPACRKVPAPVPDLPIRLFPTAMRGELALLLAGSAGS
jgi:hypothetical protein